MSFGNEDTKIEEKKIWFLDSRRSNHKCGCKEWFSDLDDNFTKYVKLGGNKGMMVKGRENIG